VDLFLKIGESEARKWAHPKRRRRPALLTEEYPKTAEWCGAFYMTKIRLIEFDPLTVEYFAGTMDVRPDGVLGVWVVFAKSLAGPYYVRYYEVDPWLNVKKKNEFSILAPGAGQAPKLYNALGRTGTVGTVLWFPGGESPQLGTLYVLDPGLGAVRIDRVEPPQGVYPDEDPRDIKWYRPVEWVPNVSFYSIGDNDVEFGSKTDRTYRLLITEPKNSRIFWIRHLAGVPKYVNTAYTVPGFHYAVPPGGNMTINFTVLMTDTDGYVSFYTFDCPACTAHQFDYLEGPVKLWPGERTEDGKLRWFLQAGSDRVFISKDYDVVLNTHAVKLARGTQTIHRIAAESPHPDLQTIDAVQWRLYRNDPVFGTVIRRRFLTISPEPEAQAYCDVNPHPHHVVYAYGQGRVYTFDDLHPTSFYVPGRWRHLVALDVLHTVS
jgi:hypothetical protein